LQRQPRWAHRMSVKFSSPDVHGYSLLLSFSRYVALCDKATKIATIDLLSHIHAKNAQKFFTQQFW
jgi:hypothetical protein